MSETNIVWAYRVSSETESELLQRMAFSFGFKWLNHGMTPGVPIQLTAPYLVFSNVFTLTYTFDERFIKGTRIPVVSTLSQALEFFKNPPIRKKEGRKVPLVRFEYKKKGKESKSYLIELLECPKGKRYIEGLDVNDNRQFKRFVYENMIGPIVFLGFSDNNN